MKLLLIIDKPYHNELKDYLISLKGINDVKISNDNYLEVNINYDNKIIDDKIILKEIYLFLDIYNINKEIPSLLGFNKYKDNVSKYETTIKDACCEYCLMGFIEDLYEKDGIISVKTNYHINLWNIKINISYDNSIISKEEIDKLIQEY